MSQVLMVTEKKLIRFYNSINALQAECKEALKKLEAQEREYERQVETTKRERAATKYKVETKLATIEDQKAVLETECASYGIVLEKSPSPLLSLPPEIRNMIYRFALVEPHKGYLKLHYDVYVQCESNLYIPRSIPLELFRVCRQINDEASSLFYSENVFAIAVKNRAVRTVGPNYFRNTRRVVDVSRIHKLHITNRESKWLSDSSRTSPTVSRDASKHHISAFTKSLDANRHQLRFLFIDCLVGFYATDRMVRNLFKPIHMLVATAALTGLTQVHIVSTNPDHFRYIRYLEKGMTDRSFLPFGIEQGSWNSFQKDYDPNGEDARNAKVGNGLAAFLKIDPCYSTPDAASAS